MENPEEVLQALDEFQKARPSEIPRELEDYLCWVARTGDPVYQWSLVKALFREKLVRVMSDFYENCPTLDLAPCPNVEQFSYDNMKQILIERLDSFNNAPFTVQRICELLTTPRKEYNRIDKFMRAIEKNILVVSTREPGPCGRRSENGDSLVNGSVDDEVSHQTSNEVDMDNWVKDCITIVVPQQQQQQQDDLELKNGMNKELELERMNHHLDPTASSFVSEFQTTTQEVDNSLPNLNQETAAIAEEMSDAIINEDTSSQPSLELESEDSSSNDKLQTTFEAKDFDTLPEDQSKNYFDNNLEVPNTTESMEPIKETIEAVPNIESKDSNVAFCPDVQNDSEPLDKDNLKEIEQTANVVPEINTVCRDELFTPDDNQEVSVDEIANVVEDITETPLVEPVTISVEPLVTPSIPEVSALDSVEPTVIENQTEEEKVIGEEPVVESTDSTSTTDSSEFTTEEILEDKFSSDMPIAEEQKEEECCIKTPTETAEEIGNNGLGEPFSTIWDEKVESNPVCNKPLTESMDVDVSSQQEEPMEEEQALEAMSS